MKTNKFFLLLAPIFLLAISAQAQLGQDLFGAPRVAVVGVQNLVPGASFVTNTVDLINYDGTAALLLTTVTNTGVATGVLTASLYGSNDKTNFTALSYALATSQSITITNRYYGGTNLTATTTYLVPGVWTYPSVASAGWATPYLASAQFTNTAALTVTTSGAYNIGLSVSDLPRYLHIVWTPTVATNFTVSALLIGQTHSAQLGN